jgi:glutathione synthase/RimK-type ligase-like ATP-grasp enzyme
VALESALAAWPQPVVNRPQYIPRTGRAVASALLRDAPGVFIPATHDVSRAQLEAIASGDIRIPALFADCDFPVILRPLGSHAGRDLARIANPEEVAAYLAAVQGEAFFLSRFIDYSGSDGLFRKFRVALIDGAAYACHMAVSSHWMVHYVNAGMYEDAAKRAEELSFMEHFDDFARRHGPALEAIWRRTQLDYLFIDCAETADGQLFVFEIDHAMVVHAMDTEDMFPYKQVHMQKVKNALRDYLCRLSAKRSDEHESA